MEIEEVKDKACRQMELLCGGMSVDPLDFEMEDWQSLADALCEYARHAVVCGSRVAGYAGYAQRRANEE